MNEVGESNSENIIGKGLDLKKNFYISVLNFRFRTQWGIVLIYTQIWNAIMAFSR